MNTQRLAALNRMLGDLKFTHPLPESTLAIQSSFTSGKRPVHVATLGNGALVQLYLGGKLRTLATLHWSAAPVAARIADAAALYFEKHRKRGITKYNYGIAQAESDLANESVLLGCLKGIEEELALTSPEEASPKNTRTLETLLLMLATLQDQGKKLDVLADRLLALEQKQTIVVAPPNPVIVQPAPAVHPWTPSPWQPTIICGSESPAPQTVSENISGGVITEISGAQ